PTLGRSDAGSDEVAHDLVVRRPRCPLRTGTTSGVALYDVLDGLVRGAADGRGATVGAHEVVGGDDVQLFPHVLQWSSLGGAVTGFDTATVHRPGAQLTDDTSRGWGLLPGHQRRPHMATSGDFATAMDTTPHHAVRPAPSDP